MGMFSKKHEEEPADKQARAPAKVADPAPSAPRPPPPSAPPAPVPTGFGIAKAISLMKSMTADPGAPLAHVKVVRRTLEAVGVQVPAILEDGNRRTKEILTEVSNLQAQVQTLEKEMAAKRKKVTELQGEMEDIQSVQDRFTAEAAASASPGASPAPGAAPAPASASAPAGPQPVEVARFKPGP